MWDGIGAGDALVGGRRESGVAGFSAPFLVDAAAHGGRFRTGDVWAPIAIDRRHGHRED